MPPMRTTLSLDSDVAASVRMEMQTRGTSLKETVNALLRLGLEAAARQPAERPRFVVRAKNLGTGLGSRYTKVSELLEHLDGADHR